MPSISIKNIGAIKSAENLQLMPVTAFCGRQGSGKSTAAKLITIFAWLEKAIFKKEIDEKELTTDVFVKKYCGFYNIVNFFNKDSYLKYNGDICDFEYSNQQLKIEQKDFSNYKLPQIMYIPSERNFMIAVENAEKISGLPLSLANLQNKYFKALKSSAVHTIGINGYKVEYDSQTQTSFLTDGENKIKTFEAASGLQSLIPIAITTEYLLQKIETADFKALSAEENAKLEIEIKNILENKNFDENIKKILIGNINRRFKTDCLWNVVEEPEQNLFPESQDKVINLLLSANNRFSGNHLIITTHSPYILNALTLSVMAGRIKEKFLDNSIVLRKLYDIIPESVIIFNNNLSVFEIKDDGTITKLESPYGIPSDNNFLNNYLEQSNTMFDELIDLEAEYES